MAQSRLGAIDVTLTVISLVTLLLDVGTDVLVTVQLYLNGDVVWGSLMVAFIVLPLLVMNVLSLKWNASDQSLTCLTLLPHVLLVSPILRYVKVIHLGIRSRTTGHPRYTDAALREQNDVCILRLVETFMESAPQLVLQLYIMLQDPAHISWLNGLSAASSLASLAWAMTAYSDTLRLAYQTTYQRRLVALALHCLWQLTMVASRVAAVVLITLIVKAWVCLFGGLHWIAMTICICVTGTDFGSGRVERLLFRTVSGFIYIFVFLNLHDGPSRGRMGAYYCLILLENAVMYAVWVVYGERQFPEMDIVAPVVVFGGFVLGGALLMVYYRWLHPSGPNYLFSLKTASTLSQQHRRTTQPEQRPMQNTSGNNSSVLELSIESHSSHRSNREGNSNLSHLLDSSTRDALQTAWQSGMDSSDSSSSSSLNEEDCSMEDYNTSVRSALCDTSRKSHRSQSSDNTTLSQSSVATVISRHSRSALRQQRSSSQTRLSQDGHANDSRAQSSASPVNLSATQSSRSSAENLQSPAESGVVMEEQEEGVVPHSSHREAADGGESVPEGHEDRRSRRRSLSPIPERSVPPQRRQAATARRSREREHEADSTTAEQEQLESESRMHQESRVQLSPLDVSQLWAESQRRATASPADASFSHLGATSAAAALVTAMSSPDTQGGESMWIASPDTSSSSNNQHIRLVDSFDSESEPACVNTADLKHLSQSKQEADEAESSWTSMKVNADESSCLDNLKDLSPDNSMCSFTSSTDKRDKANDSMAQSTRNQILDSSPSSTNEGAAQSPCLSKSRSMSSLNDDFCMEGFTPSPPLKNMLPRSRRSSAGHGWLDTPESWKQEPPPDTPWRLDYLNLDPAPPVEREAYFRRYDPRDVVIDLLMDQLKRASLRSNRSRPELSPLRLSHMQESPQRLGRSVDLFNRRAWRGLFMDEKGAGGPAHYSRDDIHRLKEALDLIEMQESPRAYRRTPETASPEMYVSGQYRPPLCHSGSRQQGASQRQVLAAQSQASRSKLVQQSGNSVFDLSTHYADHHTMPAGGHQDRPRHRSGGLDYQTSERHGLYRYFVGSDSPAMAAPPCTPHWNTPVSATTPTQRHLLRRYLSENQMRDDNQMLKNAQPPSAAASKSSRPSSVIQENPREARRSLHRPLSASYHDRKSVPSSSTYNKSTPQRQPLQTLDNSPSLSPDSTSGDPMAESVQLLKANTNNRPKSSNRGRSTVLQVPASSSDSRYLRDTPVSSAGSASQRPLSDVQSAGKTSRGVTTRKSSTGHLR